MTNRCNNCNKKIKLISYSCKCEKEFCVKCKNPEDHKCDFDFKKHQQEILRKKLITVVTEKIEII